MQNCFCQNFVKCPPIFIIFGRKMANRLKLCEMHSFSTSSDSRHHTTVLNADVQNCYTALKVVICSKLSIRITVRFKIIRIYARSRPHVHGHKRLDDDATENVKLQMRLHVFCGVIAFAASRKYVSVQGWGEGVKMRCCLLFSG